MSKTMCPFYFCLALLLMNGPVINAQEQIWRAGDQFVSVFEDKKENLLYANSCKKYNCDALKETKKLSWKQLPADSLTGGKNPGAVLCKQYLKQSIIYLRDMQGNETSFCQFKDKSFISSSSLSVIASNNDKKMNVRKK